MFIHNKIATCQKRIAGGFRTIYKGNVPISTEDCQDLHRKGSLTLQLGSDTIKFTQISIDKPAYEVIFLSNSSIDRTLPSNPCHVATKQAYFGPYVDPDEPFQYWDHITGNRYSYQKALEFVVMADIQISIDLIPGILDYKENSLAVPRMGKVLKYNSTNETVAWSSRKFGEIIVNSLQSAVSRLPQACSHTSAVVMETAVFVLQLVKFAHEAKVPASLGDHCLAAFFGDARPADLHHPAEPRARWTTDHQPRSFLPNEFLGHEPVLH